MSTEVFIGVDLGGMSAKASCLSGEGRLAAVVRAKTDIEDSPEKTINTLARLVREAAERGNVPQSSVAAVGVGAPGIIDCETGTVEEWTNFGWKRIPLAERLGSLLQKPCFVLNDANAAALGEARYGAGKRFQDSVLLTLGTGVGGGIVFSGRLYQGYKGAGGEIGHTVIKLGGRKCSCGRRGCLETYVSTRALARDALSEAKKHKDSKLYLLWRERGTADGFLLFDALKRGDACAERVFSRYIAALGEGILNLANLLRPQAVILGGGVSAEGETLLAPLRRYVNARLTAGDYAPLNILAATLGNDAGIVGAAEYARQRFS